MKYGGLYSSMGCVFKYGVCTQVCGVYSSTWCVLKYVVCTERRMCNHGMLDTYT